MAWGNKRTMEYPPHTIRDLLEIDRHPDGHEHGEGHNGAAVEVVKSSEIAAGNLHQIHAKTANTIETRVITFTSTAGAGAQAAGQSTEQEIDTPIIDFLIFNPCARGSLLGIRFGGYPLWLADENGTYHLVADILVPSGNATQFLRIPRRRYRLGLAIYCNGQAAGFKDFTTVGYANIG